MKFVKYLLISVICAIFLGSGVLYSLYSIVAPQLPDVAMLENVQMQVPMQIFSAEGELIAQFGEKQRIPLALDQVPPKLIQAVLTIEDSRFYSHAGVDPMGILRAIWVGLTSGRPQQGASTITQQLARNFFLTPEKTLLRKFKEAVLALRIERSLSKDKIFELYLNKIYFGQRAYGVGAAAHIYFGKTVEQLSLSEMALLAGLPKAPSILNPINSIERAITRRNLVLMRMLEKGYIDKAEYQQAIQEGVVAHYHRINNSVDAPHLAEMVRQEMVARLGEAAYTDGYKVYTTIVQNLQESAQRAVRENLLNYDRRHGYRGSKAKLWLPNEPHWDKQRIQDRLKREPDYTPLHPAVVIEVSGNQAKALLADGSSITLPWRGIQWARAFIDDSHQEPAPKQAEDVLAPGELIWVTPIKNQWWLAQIPEADSAMVAISPDDGAIKVLVGGFNFTLSPFNRVTQSMRQAGSSIKPFIYAATLEKGLTLATLLNDWPITRWQGGDGKDWRPKNTPPSYDGLLRLRVGLGRSKNVMAVRALRAIGVKFATEYLERFGFPANNINHSESLALGAASFNPLQMTRGYAVFANGGYLVEPFCIEKVVNAQGEVVYKSKPKKVCPNGSDPVIYAEAEKSPLFSIRVDSSSSEITPGGANSFSLPSPQIECLANCATGIGGDTSPCAPHVIHERVAFLMRSALTSAIWGEPEGRWVGTGWRAIYALKRHDIGGKTGTTNDSKDAWFSGFGPGLVATAWIGFDQHQRDLGQSEADPELKDLVASGGEGGAKSAQPAWNSFMREALKNIPEEPEKIPSGIVTVRIDIKSGQVVNHDGAGTKLEHFIDGSEPEQTTQDTRSEHAPEQQEEVEIF